MARLATLGGAVAGRLQASLFHARAQRRSRAAGAPANTSAPSISGTTTVGQTLTVDEGTWSNSPTAYRYVWRRDGAIISGANAATYELVAEDEGASINCTVIAVNGNGSQGATADAVGPVAGA